MAAENEKLSINRRRLFKALSAAPVVATLRPGEALATSSSFQCAEPLRELNIAQFLNENEVSSVEAGFGENCQINGAIHRIVRYWQKADIVREELNRPWKRQRWDELADFMVEIPVFDHNGDETEVCVDLVSPVQPGVVTPVGTNVYLNNRNKLVVCEDDTHEKKAFRLSPKRGAVISVYTANEDDTEMTHLGYHPQYSVESAPTLEPGTQQAMGESCLTSFMEANAVGLNNM